MERTLSVLDYAVLVVSGSEGVQGHTETLWKLLDKYQVPTFIFVNKMDRENADFHSILDNLRGKFGKRVLPLQLPLGQAEKFEGIIDLFKMKAYRANGNGSDEIEIPDEYKQIAEEAHEKMVEAAVEADDDCMMRYLEGETISNEEIMKCLINGIRQAIIYPMICGSAFKNIGLGRLMNAIIDYTYPAILNDYIVIDKATGEEEIRDANAPMAALVFKTTSDPFVGRLSTAKFTAGMQNRKYDFYCGNTCLVIDTYRNSSSVIDNSDRIIFVDRYINGIAESCQCFIYRIINDLIHQMMQSSAGCGTNIHSRTLSYSFQTFQYLNLIRAVFMFYRGIVPIFFAHDSSHSALQAAKIIFI